MPTKLFILSLMLLTLLASAFVQAKEPRIPAQTITSELEMEIGFGFGKAMSWSGCGKTPGSVEIPQCDRIIFALEGLGEKNIEAYKKEMSRLRMRYVGLPGKVTDSQLKTYVNAGLLQNITLLYLAWRTNLTDITPLANLPNLTSLDLSGCHNLTGITPLAKLKNLTSLDLSGCDNLKDITPLAKLQKLTSLDLSHCRKLSDITLLAKLQNLTSLDLGGCNNLTDITPLASLQNLTSLDLGWCDKLTDIAPLAALRKLAELNLSGCEEIRDIQPLAWLPNLVVLSLDSCRNIKNFYPISAHKKLERLVVTIPGNDLSFLRNLRQLKTLYFVDCHKLINVASLAGFRKLEDLKFCNCKLVTEENSDALQKNLPKCKIANVESSSYFVIPEIGP